MDATCLICHVTIRRAGHDLPRDVLVEHVLVNHRERVRHGGLFTEALGCFDLQPRDAEHDSNEDHGSREPRIEGEQTNAAPAGPVLVVEDNEDLREAMLARIARAGFPVRGVENGKQALEVLRGGTERPSLIVLDLMMPVMNGLEFRQRQLADAALSSIPVVVMTAYGRTADSSRFRGAEVLEKPIALDRMLDAVRDRCLRV